MQCPICEASIDEIEASTCPSCGAHIAEPDFTRGDPVVLDGHDGKIIMFDERRANAAANETDDHIIHRATEAEELLAAEEFEPPYATEAPVHHPSRSAQRKLKPVKFFLFRVTLKGKNHHLWVRSTAKTPARENLLAWIRSHGWRPCDSSGEEFPWGLSGKDLAIRYKAEMPLENESTQLPDGIVGYIDAYYRDRPVHIKLRD